jgi:dipeptidyl aminopeptidase/acylaminoacyl peptidase
MSWGPCCRLADKISVPLLLVHGSDDNNTGTFPMQSERFYQALKGKLPAMLLPACMPSS